MTRGFGKGIAYGSLFLSLAACSAPEQPEVGGRGEHPSQTAQALDARSDRPAAAAVGVLVDSAATAPLEHQLRATRQLWLFACSSDHLLQRRVRADQRSAWSAWTVEAGAPCAGTPSAAAWSVSPHDTVEVVYRSTENHLIELTYEGDQAAHELDLSEKAHFGALASNCNPVIADMGNGLRVSIAVRNPNNQLFAVTAYAGRWHVQPARDSNGAQVFAESTLVGWYSNQRAFLSAVHNGVSQTFTRSTWTQGFKAFNGPVPSQASHGLITFTTFQGRIHALGRDETGRLLAAPVDQSWSFTPTPAPSVVQSTVYLGAPFAYHQAGSGNTAAVGITGESRASFVTGVGLFNGAGVNANAQAVSRVASANTVVANPGSELWSDNFVADSDDQLLWWSGSSHGFTPMGLAVSY